jgi:transcriptional regulator with XRE-family HTH domain
MKAAAWIDRLKNAHGWESDYRVAKELGLSRQAVSEYRNRVPTMDEGTALKVAQSLGIDPALILTDQAMERAKDDQARAAWADVLKRLGGVAASVLLTAGIGAGTGLGQEARASQPGSDSANGGAKIHIVLSK